MRSFFIFFLSFFIFGNLYAKSNLYQVEVIIFENRKLDKDIEQLPRFVGDLQLKRTVQLKPLAEDSSVKDYRTFLELNSDKWQLSKEHSILSKSSRYRVIEHKSWLQSVKGNKKSKKVHLIGGANLGKTTMGMFNDWEIEGVIDVSRHGAFYCKADFIFKKVNLPNNNEDNGLFLDDNKLLSEYRITQSAKLKMKNVQFFDHPMFGVLVAIKEPKFLK